LDPLAKGQIVKETAKTDSKKETTKTDSKRTLVWTV
jgi:hypothetical protein